MREALGHLQAQEGFLYIKVYFRADSKSSSVLCLHSPAVLDEALQGVGWMPAGDPAGAPQLCLHHLHSY